MISVHIINHSRGFYLFLKPRLIQLIIHPLIRQQLGVRSLLNDLPIMNDHDLIRACDGRKAMRDHKRRAPVQESCQRALNDLLGLRIH